MDFTYEDLALVFVELEAGAEEEHAEELEVVRRVEIVAVEM